MSELLAWLLELVGLVLSSRLLILSGGGDWLLVWL